jgi:hypothetical protein
VKFGTTKVVVGALGLVALGFYAGSRSLVGEAQDRMSATPLILNKVQALGDLHTARYSYEHVFDYSTSLQPEQWTRYVPGMANLITASTRNTALLDTTGQVEAGVDLAKATVGARNGRKTLILPKPKLYPAHVSANVHAAKPGMFWRDDNLSLKAVRAAEAQISEAAKRQGILDDAQQNARDQLTRLVPEVANYEISFQ